MKALVQDRYGSPEDALRIRDIDPPRIGEDGVLVRVHAASVNALDWHVTRGLPYVVRMMEGPRRPRTTVRGVDFAGRVEAVGERVTRVKPGDDVYGGATGAFAELAATTPARIATKPRGLPFEAAATLHVAGLTALQGLRDQARVRPGQRVLVNGAGGGVGTFAVQIAKWLGAHVTAVTRKESADLARSIGADEAIDHEAEDFTRSAAAYDAIIDIGGNRTLAECRRALTRHGTLVVVGGPAGRLAPATRMLKAALASPLAKQRIRPFVSKEDHADLALLGELAADGTITPVIGAEYPLDRAADAIRHLGEGRVRGKVVVRVG